MGNSGRRGCPHPQSDHSLVPVSKMGGKRGFLIGYTGPTNLSHRLCLYLISYLSGGANFLASTFGKVSPTSSPSATLIPFPRMICSAPCPIFHCVPRSFPNLSPATHTSCLCHLCHAIPGLATAVLHVAC